MKKITNHWLPLGFISIGLLCTALSGFAQLLPKFERNEFTTNVTVPATGSGLPVRSNAPTINAPTLRNGSNFQSFSVGGALSAGTEFNGNALHFDGTNGVLDIGGTEVILAPGAVSVSGAGPFGIGVTNSDFPAAVFRVDGSGNVSNRGNLTVYGNVTTPGTVTAAGFVGSGANSGNLHLGASNTIGGISFQPAHDLPVNITNIFNFTNVVAGQTLCVESSNNWVVVWKLCTPSSGSTNYDLMANNRIYLSTNENTYFTVSNATATGVGVLHLIRSNIAIMSWNLTNGFNGILKPNPATALDVFGTATASFFSGGQYQINGVEAVGSSGFALRLAGGAWTHIALGTTNVPVGVGSSAATAKLHVNSGSNEFMLKLSSPAGDHITVRTNAITLLTNMSLAFQAGGNQRLGSATLVNGTVTVGNTAVTANTKVMAWFSAVGGTTAGILTGSVVAGTSFTITSVGATGTTVSTDTSVVNYLLIDNP